MAESKFLKYQDRNGDSLIDICEIDLGPPEQPVCKDCVPNPKALVPNWKTSPPLEPFLNEKKCLYQVTKVTPHTKIKADVDDNFEEFKEEAIDSLLNFYDKDESHSSKEKMRENITFDRYVDSANGSKYYKISSFAGLSTDQTNLLRSNPTDLLYNQESMNCMLIGIIQQLIVRIEDLETP